MFKGFYTLKCFDIKAQVVNNNNLVYITVEIRDAMNGILVVNLVLAYTQICNITKRRFRQ